MVNTEMLEDRIERSGLKKNAIADRLGISREGLRLKIIGTNEFKGSEIQKLKVLLNLSKSERDAIFFSHKVI